MKRWNSPDWLLSSLSTQLRILVLFSLGQHTITIWQYGCPVFKWLGHMTWQIILYRKKAFFFSPVFRPPFENRTQIYHSNTRLVRYSDGYYCTIMWTTALSKELNSKLLKLVWKQLFFDKNLDKLWLMQHPPLSEGVLRIHQNVSSQMCLNLSTTASA